MNRCARSAVVHPELRFLREPESDDAGGFHDDAEPERLERRGVERAGCGEIRDRQSDVVEDVGWILGRHGTTLPRG
jgi:hypothetical protein